MAKENKSNKDKEQERSFERFKELTRMLVSVPKKEIEQAEEKNKRRSKKRRPVRSTSKKNSRANSADGR